MSAWLVVLGAGAGSFLLRFGLVAGSRRRALPRRLERLADDVVPACFAALAAPALVPTATGVGTDSIPLAAAVAVTVLIAVRGRTAATAFACGLVTLWASTAAAALLPIGA